MARDKEGGHVEQVYEHLVPGQEEVIVQLLPAHSFTSLTR